MIAATISGAVVISLRLLTGRARPNNTEATQEWNGLWRGRESPVVQKQIPFVSLRAHRRGLCLLWRRSVRQSAVRLVGLACRLSKRLVAHLSQRSPSFRRHGGGLDRTRHGFSCLGMARASRLAGFWGIFCPARPCPRDSDDAPSFPLKCRPPRCPFYWSTPEFSFDKGINLSVHDRLDVAAFNPRAMIL